MKKEFAKEFEVFKAERNTALFSLDKEKILAYLKKYHMDAPEQETTFWAGVYQAILVIQETPEELRETAEKWLTEHGFTRK